MDKNRVLIGAGGSGTSFAIARLIKANWPNDEVVIVDTNPRHLVATSLFADESIQVPAASSQEFKSQVKSIINSRDITVFIPILNEEIELAFELKSEFPKVKSLVFGESANLLDKAFLAKWLTDLGIKTPKLLSVREALDSRTDVFVKPRIGLGSRHSRVVLKSELPTLADISEQDFVIQELCEHPEVTVDSFYDNRAKVILSYTRERIEVKSGVCTKARVYFDSELNQIALQIAEALGQNGTICFQAMRTHDYWAVTDVNLRTGAGTSMTVATGFDVISASYALLTGSSYQSFLRPLADNEEHYVTRQYTEFVTKSHET